MAERRETTKQAAGNQGKDEVPGQVSTRFCQPCSSNSKKTAASVFCPTCNEFQCKECSDAHSIYSFMKAHKLVDASAASDKAATFDMNGLDRCEKHNKHIKFFCMDDKKLCCSTCAIIEHRKCNRVDEIKNIDVEQISINTLKVHIINLKERNEAATKHWTETEKHMHYQIKDLLKRLDAVRSSVKNRLDSLENDIKKQTNAISEVKAMEFGNNRAQCEKLIRVLEHNIDILDAVVRQGTKEQQFIVQQRVNESLQTTNQKSISALSKLEGIELLLKLSNPLKQFVDSSENNGSVKTNTNQISIDDIVEGTPVTLEKIISIDIEQSKEDKKEPYFTGIDFLSDGRLVVVDNYNGKCLIYNDRLKKLGSFESSDQPLSIASVSDDEVAVTSGGKILFFNVSNTNKITQIRTVKTTSKYDSICMNDDDHFVAGTFDDTRPVRIVSLTGEESDFNIGFPSKDFSLGTSTCTYIKNHDKIVPTDRHEHTVYIYDVRNNTSVVVRSEQIKEPRGVAIGPHENVFICSYETNSIVQMSKTGMILSSHKLDMGYHFRICISKDKTKLAVSNSKISRRKLQLFSIKL